MKKIFIIAITTILTIAAIWLLARKSPQCLPLQELISILENYEDREETPRREEIKEIVDRIFKVKKRFLLETIKDRTTINTRVRPNIDLSYTSLVKELAKDLKRWREGIFRVQTDRGLQTSWDYLKKTIRWTDNLIDIKDLAKQWHEIDKNKSRSMYEKIELIKILCDDDGEWREVVKERTEAATRRAPSPLLPRQVEALNEYTIYLGVKTAEEDEYSAILILRDSENPKLAKVEEIAAIIKEITEENGEFLKKEFHTHQVNRGTPIIKTLTADSYVKTLDEKKLAKIQNLIAVPTSDTWCSAPPTP